MPLPWTAPGFGQGIYPSQAPFFIPDRVDPRLVASIAAQRGQQQEEIGNAIQGVMAGLGKMIEQRRQDAIASQLLAGSAPAATTPEGLTAAEAAAKGGGDQAYAQRGLELSPTGQPIPAALAPAFTPPATVLNPAEAAQNAALGYPSQQLMKPHEIYGARENLYDQSLGDMLKQAHIARLIGLARGHETDPNKAPTGKIWSTSLGGWATPTQDAAERRRQAAEAAGTESAGAKAFYKDLEAKHGGLSAEILNKLDTTTAYDPKNPATIEYINAKGEHMTFDEATKAPQKAFAVSPSFKGKIPLLEFNTLLDQHRNIQSARKTGPAAGGVGGYQPGQVLEQDGVKYRVGMDGVPRRIF